MRFVVLCAVLAATLVSQSDAGNLRCGAEESVPATPAPTSVVPQQQWPSSPSVTTSVPVKSAPTQAPVTDQVPVSTTAAPQQTASPAPTKEQVPAASMTQTPITTQTASPAPTKEQVPAASMTQTPITTQTAAPVPTKEQVPAASMTQTPITTQTAAPVPTKEQVPAAYLTRPPIVTAPVPESTQIPDTPAATPTPAPPTTQPAVTEPPTVTPCTGKPTPVPESSEIPATTAPLTTSSPATPVSTQQSSGKYQKVIAVASDPPQTQPAAPATPAPQPPAASDWMRELLNIINTERANNGLAPLCLTSKLIAAAQSHAEEMANMNYFDHNSLDGTDPFARAQSFGYADGAFENIAAGQSDPTSLMVSWMNSAGHRAGILSDSTQVGLGRAYNADSEFGTYWVADFGSSSSEACM